MRTARRFDPRFLVLVAALASRATAHAAPAVPPGAVAGAAEAAKRDYRRMYEAFQHGDLNTFARLTYPGLLKLMGGKERMIALLEEGTAGMKKQGFSFKSAEVGAVLQMVAAGSELHAILPLNQIMAAPGGELHADGHVLGVSQDKGKTWTFVDASSLDAAKAKLVLPVINPALKFPPKGEPRFIKK